MSGPGGGDVVARPTQASENPSAVSVQSTLAQPLPTGDAFGIGPGEETEGDAPAPFQGNLLAGHINTSWARNKRARDVLDERMLANLRARRCVYSSGEMQDMWTADAGEQIYLGIAATKMRAAEAALRELILPEGDRPWGLSPSPLPELPPEVTDPINAEAAQLAQQEMAQAFQGEGRTFTKEEFEKVSVKLAEKLKDMKEAELRVEAKQRAARMEDAIDERMDRGGYYKAMAEFISNFCTQPAAVLKGPFLRRKKRLKWLRTGEPDVVSAPELTWTAPNPFDCFPAPEAESCQDGDFIERIRMSRADLYDCIGVPGYNEAAIRNALQSHASGNLRAWLWTDAERRMLENVTHDVWLPDHLIDALHYWGSVEGQVLLDYGLSDGIDDPLAYYEVDAVMIGSEVIRCEINDDPLGRRPYFNAAFDPVPGAFWGNSIYELMRDCQSMVNACARALNANLALASGPIMGIDMAQLAAGQDPKALRPLQIIQLDRSRAQAAASPIEWYQADSRATELLGIIDKFEAKADDLTGLPRYLNGVQDATGAAATASGLSMLMGTAAKGLRRAVANIDKGVISQTVEACYVHEMLYNPDETIKGDCTVIARGAAAVLVKEHLQQTRTQFLAMTANPTDMQIIGVKGRRAVLQEVATALEMPKEEIFGTDQEWNERMDQAKQVPPQPSPDAVLRSKTDLARETIKSHTTLAKAGMIHPHGAVAAAAAAQSLPGADAANQPQPGPGGTVIPGGSSNVA